MSGVSLRERRETSAWVDEKGALLSPVSSMYARLDEEALRLGMGEFPADALGVLP